MLGVAPALGRTFSAEEADPMGTRAVVLSHGLWSTRSAVIRSQHQRNDQKRCSKERHLGSRVGLTVSSRSL